MTTSTSRLRAYRLRGTVGDEEISFFLPPGLHAVGSDLDHPLNLPWEGVSRRHALLEVEDDQVVVIDQESKNGTFLNGHQIRRAEVEAGDVLSFGPVELRLETVAAVDATLAVSLIPEPRTGGSSRPGEGKTTAPFHRSRGDEVERWLRFIRGYGDDLALAAEGCGAALSRLAAELGTRGACLLTFDRARSESLVAVAGDVDTGALRGWLGEVPSLDSDRKTLLGEGFLISRPEATGFIVPREQDHLALVVVGDFGGREACEPLLSTLLSLTRNLVSLPVSGAPSARSSDPSKLRFPPGHIRGRSPGMEELYRRLEPLVEGDLPVLIEGETGVGKELIAQILHLSSPRRRGPFVAINCAAIPAELLEAELFGIGDRVATGVAGRRGQFQQAEGGTLFLDEVGEMPAALQAKLLRVLQEKRLRPLGGAAITIDVRLVTATNADLPALIEDGSFRRDLYFRIAGCALHVPSLAERREDIPLLIEGFLRRLVRELDKPIRGLTIGALERLLDRSWPGNVRQLEHEIQRLVYACPRGGVIESGMIASAESPPPAAAAGENKAESGQEASPEVISQLPTLELAELERLAILEALRRTGGNQVQAARLLGVSRHILRRRLDQLETS